MQAKQTGHRAKQLQYSKTQRAKISKCWRAARSAYPAPPKVKKRSRPLRGRTARPSCAPTRDQEMPACPGAAASGWYPRRTRSHTPRLLPSPARPRCRRLPGRPGGRAVDEPVPQSLPTRIRPPVVNRCCSKTNAEEAAIRFTIQCGHNPTRASVPAVFWKPRRRRGAGDNSYMTTQQPPLCCGAYGSSPLTTTPHTDGTM